MKTQQPKIISEEWKEWKELRENWENRIRQILANVRKKNKVRMIITLINNIIRQQREAAIKECLEAVEGIDVSGGGSGRRLKIQLIAFLNNLLDNK